MSITSETEPTSYKVAFLDENWRLTVTDEMTACEDQGTQTVEILQSCKWVFRLKFNVDGTLSRYKAIFVVLENNQTEGVDYNETFAPVAKMVTIPAFFQQVVSLDWKVHQIDVHNAFLHADLDEEVYMQFSSGFRTDDKSKVCRLHKSLYGLKKSP